MSQRLNSNRVTPSEDTNDTEKDVVVKKQGSGPKPYNRLS